jgi:hypothetical protein
MLKQSISSVLFLLILFASVVTQAEQESGSILPTWVTAPPKDTPDTMWGVGEGSDLDSAKRSALKDIAAKLNVAISAQLESRVTVSSNSVDRYARTRVAEDVQRTEFKNYSLEKSMQTGQDFYALVSVDRRAFIVEAEQKLVMAEKEITINLAGSEKGNAIEKFVAQQKALPWIEKAVASSQVLSAADASFDGKRLRKHEAALAKAKAAASELTFDIKVKNDSRDVAQTVINFLNESGMRIGGGGSPLVIETIATLDSVFGSFTVQLRINLSVLDAQGRNLTSKEFTVNGSSMTDHRAARQAALQELGEKLREAGPLVALGFNLS